MANLNLNEVGSIIRVNVGEDIAGTTPTLILLPEIGNEKEITDGVSIPNVNVTADGIDYLADEYIEYATLEKDLDYAGRWKKKAKIKFSASVISQTDFVKFRVLS